jgi:hypothetical protein
MNAVTYWILLGLFTAMYVAATYYNRRAYRASVKKIEATYVLATADSRDWAIDEANRLIEKQLALNDADVVSLRAENMRLRSQVETLQTYAKDHVVFQAREYIDLAVLAQMPSDPGWLEHEMRHRLAGELAGSLTKHAVMKSWVEDRLYRRQVVEMRVPIASFVPDEAMTPVPSPRWETAASYAYPRVTRVTPEKES